MIGFYANGCTIRAVDMNLTIYPWLLRVAYQNICHSTIFEFQNSQCSIVDFDVWMIDIFPGAVQFFNFIAHVPL